MRMKTACLAAVAACVLAVPAVAGAAPASHQAQTWKNVTIVDQHASTQFKADPDSLTKSQEIQQARSGFGFWTADGRFLKLDKVGDEAWLDMLKKSKETSHLRGSVTGVLHGSTITVKSISLL